MHSTAADDTQRPLLQAFCLLMLAHQAGYVLRSVNPLYGAGSWLTASELVFMGLAVALAATSRLAWAIGSMAVVSVLEVVATFPATANHGWLQMAVLLLLASYAAPGRRVEEPLRLLQWLCAAVIALTGVQKLLHGTWSQAQFIATYVDVKAGFGFMMKLIDPVGVEALRYVDESQLGAGPIRSYHPLMIAISNLVWILELLIPAGLLWKRTRSAVAWFAIFFFLMIQFSAREFTFGILMSGLVAIWLPQSAAVKTLKWLACCALLLTGWRMLSGIPGLDFLAFRFN